MWMEHLEEDVRGPMRQEDITWQDDCSASYRPTVRDGDSVDG